MSIEINSPEASSLGKKVQYIDQYDKSLLFPIPRLKKREEIGIDDKKLPFSGLDCWNGYEISWLNKKGKPIIALGTFLFPCNSSCLIESKSFKLYLNSLNQTRFQDLDEVTKVLKEDLSEAAKADVQVKLQDAGSWQSSPIGMLEGISLDDLDISISDYGLNSSYLKTGTDTDNKVSEVLCSNLLKSNCLVTGQPDWGSVLISYVGKKIDHEALLKYIISFRQHNEFHEQCVERIFSDIQKYCAPEKLSVYARYTRRGGLDINPFRSNFENFSFYSNIRQVRQ